MPIYQLPDGRKFDVPASVPQERAIMMLREKFGKQQETIEEKPQSPKKPLSLADKIAASLRGSDIQGLPASALPMALQQPAMQAGGELPITTPTELKAQSMGALKGATFNFSPEVAGFIGSIFSDESPDTLTEQYRTEERKISRDFPIEFTGGELGAGLGIGSAGASTKLGTKLAENIGRSGTLMKMLKTGAIGGISGALSGAGATPESRETGAIAGGAAGSLAGTLPLGEVTLSKVAKIGGVDKLKSLMNRFVGSENPAEELFIPMTLGQRGQDATQQAFEEAALKGTKGEKAKDIISRFRGEQNKAIRERINRLREGTAETAQEAITGAVDVIKAENDILRKQVDNAYQLAREKGEASMQSFDLNTILLDGINNTAETFNLSLTPRAAAKLNDLKNIAAQKLDYDLIKGVKPSPIDFRKLENWRGDVSGLLAEASNKGDSRDAKLLGSMLRQFDQFIEVVTEKGLIEGDKEVINGIIKARELRRELGKRFESNKIVNDILTSPEYTPEQVTAKIIGASKFAGKKDAADTVNALIRAGGERGGQVKQQLKSGILHRLVKNSESKQLTTDDTPFISPAKLSTSLDDLFEGNASLLRSVFDENEIKSLSNLKRNVSKIASIQPGGYNASGSGAVIARAIRDTFGKIPVVGDIIGAVSDNASANEALRAVSQINNNLRDEITGKAFILSGIEAGKKGAEESLVIEGE